MEKTLHIVFGLFQDFIARGEREKRGKSRPWPLTCTEIDSLAKLGENFRVQKRQISKTPWARL